MRNELTLVAIGSPHGDDSIAWKLIDRLCDEVIDKNKITFIKCDRTPFDFWGKVSLPSSIIVLDALWIDSDVGNGQIGRIHVFELIEGECEVMENAGLANSSHLIDTVTALKLAQRLDALPQRVEIWGIEIKQRQALRGLSRELSQQMSQIVASLKGKIITKLEHSEVSVQTMNAAHD